MSRLDNALRNLGRAHLMEDATLRARAMHQLLSLAALGSDTAAKGTAGSGLFRPLPPSQRPPLSYGDHDDVHDVHRWGRSARGSINGEGAQLYYGKGYRTIVRELADKGRVSWRPAEGPGGRAALWLTDEEAAVVRAAHDARYQVTA